MRCALTVCPSVSKRRYFTYINHSTGIPLMQTKHKIEKISVLGLM